MKEKLQNLWLNYKMVVYMLLFILLIIVIPNMIWGDSLVQIGIEALPPLGQDIVNYTIVGLGCLGVIYVLIKSVFGIRNLIRDLFGKK